ncbi:SymE family type I addiction module toxin [Collimonas antrihumi]|uniref:SymE family type I addiction module toxin n=1 Tax=Collimonas antrihumi TaxID=1940615 RepID=UPI001B8D0112|nr:SymE family type I addiction module toxin [Collimonas antrihumi]
MAKRNSTRDSSTSIVNAAQRLNVSFYQDDDPETLWIRLHGNGIKQTGFNPNANVRVRVMTGCLMITSD